MGNYSAYRTTDVAKLLGVTPNAVRRWVREEGLPVIRVCGSQLIPRKAFEQWLHDVYPQIQSRRYGAHAR